jgi:hypothetical protein
MTFSSRPARSEMTSSAMRLSAQDRIRSWEATSVIAKAAEIFLAFRHGAGAG